METASLTHITHEFRYIIALSVRLLVHPLLNCHHHHHHLHHRHPRHHHEHHGHDHDHYRCLLIIMIRLLTIAIIAVSTIREASFYQCKANEGIPEDYSGQYRKLSL